MTASLEFREVDHCYLVDGRPVPSVTQILDAFGMVDGTWHNPEALAWGRAVHHAIHLINHDDLDWASIDPRISGYIQAYVNFRAQTGFTSLVSEQRLAHPGLGYAGTLDDMGFATLDGISDREKVTLIDYKTGVPAPWHHLQLAAYHGLVEANAAALGLASRSELPSRWIVVHLRADATYQLRPIPVRTDRTAFHVARQRFLALVDLYHLRSKYIHD